MQNNNESIINEFLKLYDDIIIIYKSNNNDLLKNISKILNQNNNIIRQIFYLIKKNDERKLIKLNYLESFENINNKIKIEKNYLYQLSYIINCLHIIIYDILSKKNNYDFSLDGKKEMKILKKKNIQYYIIINSDNEKLISFHAFFLLYALESLFNKYFYICIDFEYTNRKIQLSQLNFEHEKSNKSFIMLINPDELNNIILNDFIDLIICSNLINKILHGAEALDIPYIYINLLKEDPEKIIKFTKNIIDTRYLCEYYKLSKLNDNIELDNKCSIYDEDPKRSAIYYFGVISKNQQQKLTNMIQSLPVPKDITWNIHKMAKSQKLYAQYDVLYLKYFYYKIINVAYKNKNTKLEKKMVINLYKYILNELTSFIYLEKNKITFLTLKCKAETDPINNYFVKKNNNMIRLIEIYGEVSKNLEIFEPNLKFDNLLNVNYYKNSIIIILKRFVYGFISYNCRVYKNRNEYWNDKLDIDFIFYFFKELKYFNLYKIFKKVSIILEKNVKNNFK